MHPIEIDFLLDTMSLVKEIETRFLELGARLFKIQEEELWKSEYQSFAEYVDAAGLRRPFASTLITIHKVYVLQHQIPSTELAAAGYSKLYDAIPLLKSEDVETVVAKARLLTTAELRDEVHEDKHGECSHPETINICADCKKRIYDQE